MAAARICVRRADWQIDREILSALREEVFIREQSVPVEMEWDAFDSMSQHVLASVDALPVGTGRLLPDGHIGRMAVLRAWRGQGAGTALLRKLIEMARASGMRRVLLHAQVQAIPFYLRHEFQVQGDKFLEAGIAHQQMMRDL